MNQPGYPTQNNSNHYPQQMDSNPVNLPNQQFDPYSQPQNNQFNPNPMMQPQNNQFNPNPMMQPQNNQFNQNPMMPGQNVQFDPNFQPQNNPNPMMSNGNNQFNPQSNMNQQNFGQGPNDYQVNPMNTYDQPLNEDEGFVGFDLKGNNKGL